MKKNNKTIRMICMISVLLLLISPMNVLATEGYSYETPVNEGYWMEPGYDDNYAYSIAFVGDTQYITTGDDYIGTRKLNQVYKYIADTAEERKLEHVFVLGDITDRGYQNDANLASKHVSPAYTGEWEIAKEAISQLDGVVSYSLCRGNHDDYMIDDYFNVPEYTDQFKDCGGFFSDSDGKHPVEKSREELNPDGYIYWTEKSGHYENSIVNSWKTANICGVDYLFITVDYNPTEAVCNWLDNILTEYPNHRAIITTHAYLNSSGNPILSENGNTMYPTGYHGSYLWSNVLSKHSNVLMVVSGHVPALNTVQTWGYGEDGNCVLQVLVDPQGYDAKEDADGKIIQGTQDTGLVLYMNFSEDGNTITLDYYSTLLNKNLMLNRHVIDLTSYTIKQDTEMPRRPKRTTTTEKTTESETEETTAPESEETTAPVTEDAVNETEVTEETVAATTTANPSETEGIGVGTIIIIVIAIGILICIGMVLHKRKSKKKAE